jgi:hypothetical protein
VWVPGSEPQSFAFSVPSHSQAEVAVIPEVVEPTKSPAWQMAPFDAAKSRLISVRNRTKLGFLLPHFVWCEMQKSAQQFDDGGRFQVDRAVLAFMSDADETEIDAILAAFVDVGLIVDGRCATFIPRKISRDKAYYAAKKLRDEKLRNADPAHPDLLEAPDAAPDDGPRVASQNGAVASQIRAESSESIERLDLEIPPQSSVVVVAAASAGATTTTREEMFTAIRETGGGRIADKVIRRGLPRVEEWIKAGYDFHLDILPELAEIAGNSAKPLMTLEASFIPPQLTERRANRRLTSGVVTDGLHNPRAPPAGRAGGRDWDAEALREIRANG